MIALSDFLISFNFSLSANALTDSVRIFPTTLQNWTVTSHHMDTGDLRACSAKGRFNGLDIEVGNSFGTKPLEINFRFVNGNAPGPRDPGDQRACGVGKDQAQSGAWRYSPENSREEFCDGNSWLKLTEGNFRKAVLMLDGIPVATTEEGANFKLGLVAGKPVFFEYWAWFQQVEALENELTKPGKIELRV